MAHGITETDNMFATETPWHRLGVVIDKPVDNAADALTLAGLDWHVGQYPVFTEFNGERVEVEGKWVNIREDTGEPLAVVGDRYTPVQNDEGLFMLDVLLREGSVEIHTAGSLFGGRVVWALAAIPKEMEIAGHDLVPYVLFSNSHDGTKAVSLTTTPVYVVCNNTLRYSFRNTRTQWSHRHTPNATKKVEEARQDLGLVFEYYDEFQVEAERLLRQKVSGPKFDQVIDLVEPMPEAETDKEKEAKKNAITRANNRRAAIRTQYGKEDAKGTAWGVLNAFNTYNLWGVNARGRDAFEAQADRILRGKTTDYDSRVLDALAAVK